MPDITMCATVGCMRASSCYRSAASGTQATERRQSYALFAPDPVSGECENYWGPVPYTTNHTGVADNG